MKKLDVSTALKDFYPKFAGYVIQSRALPDSRDGLKRGARYILYSQYKNKLTYTNKRKKSTATVSATMQFNPHGDRPIYETLVRLAQPFSMRYIVQDPHGNFGGLLGMAEAAPRYTETRSNEIAYEMTRLLDKETVEWIPNFDETADCPVVLPSLFPFALTNGK